MIDYWKRNPVFTVAAIVAAIFVYGWWGATEKRPPHYSDDHTVEIKSAFLNFQFPTEYPSEAAFSESAFRFRQRGYGIGFQGSLPDADGNVYRLAEIDVPNDLEEMVIVYRRGNAPMDPMQYFSHFVIEHKVEDELIQPRRVVKIEGNSINFLSDGKVYKSYQRPTAESKNEAEKR